MASWFLCGARVDEMYRVEMFNETKRNEKMEYISNRWQKNFHFVSCWQSKYALLTHSLAKRDIKEMWPANSNENQLNFFLVRLWIKCSKLWLILYALQWKPKNNSDIVKLDATFCRLLCCTYSSSFHCLETVVWILLINLLKSGGQKERRARLQERANAAIILLTYVELTRAQTHTTCTRRRLRPTT